MPVSEKRESMKFINNKGKDVRVRAFSRAAALSIDRPKRRETSHKKMHCSI